MFHKNFKHLPWTESIEVARQTIGGLIPKNHIFSGVFFSETAHELLVPAYLSNTHPRPYLMQKNQPIF